MQIIVTLVLALPVLLVLHGLWKNRDRGLALSTRLSLMGGEAGDLLFDIIDPQKLLGFVRALEFPEFTLARYLPDQTIRDITYLFYRGALSDADAAMFRAWDTEAPIMDRQGTERVTGELPPISVKIPLREFDRLRLEAINTGDDSRIVEAIFNDVRNTARAVAARVELARGEALWNGRITFDENGMFGVRDYAIPASHRVAPATLWPVATAPILDDLLAWLDIYIATNGFPPGEILTSTRVRGFMLRNEPFRQLAGARGITPAMLTAEDLNQLLSVYGLPPVRTNDTIVRKRGVPTRVIPDDRLVFLPPQGIGADLGRTFHGITAEALELRAEGQIVAGQEPGVVTVIERTFDPVVRWTKSTTIALPVVGNPGYLLTADVA